MNSQIESNIYFHKKRKSHNLLDKKRYHKKPVKHRYGNAVIVSSGKCFHVQFRHGLSPSPPLSEKNSNISI